MANQMIALQARNPQLPDPSRAAAQYANMMNMASQQRASQLQGERIRQEMDFEAAKEARAVETQAATMREKDLDIEDKELARLYKMGAAILETEDPTAREAAYQNLLGLIENTSPQLGATMRQVAGTFNAQVLQSVMVPVVDYFNKKYPTPTTETAFGPRDEILEVTRGGLPGVAGVRPLLNMPPQGAPASPAAAPRTPVALAPAGAPMRATRGANTTPQDLMQQGMDPRNIPSGMPTVRPISFNQSDMGGAGQMPPDMVPAILDSAINTGVMAQIDLDQMLALAPPQARQGIMDVIRDNKIALQADAPSLAVSAMPQQQPMATNPVQRPQATFADMRGPAPQASLADLGGQPQMQNVMAQTNVLGQQAYGRSGSPTSPVPGSSRVPIERVRQEAVAGRETADEVYAKEKARARAQREAAIEAGPKPLTPVQEAKLRDNIAKDYKSARSTISMMLDPVSGVVAAVNKVRNLSPSQKEAITGYSGYLPSITPGSRSADTAIKNLRGKVTEMGKSAAALTGAIGQMAVQEWRIVSDMIASLDIEGMEPADLDNQLDIIDAQARRAAEVTRDAYENQYVEEFARYPGRFQLPSATGKTPVVSRPKAESQLPRIRGNADYNKLKPGTEFIDPNGVRRRKPK